MDEIRAISDVLAEADVHLAAGRSAAAQVWPTGFPVLDGSLGGGLRSRELALLGGAQGLGKTSFVLQILRDTVASGGAGVYFSYEHDPVTVLQRLIAMEAAQDGGIEAPPLRTIRETMEAPGGAGMAARWPTDSAASAAPPSSESRRTGTDSWCTVPPARPPTSRRSAERRWRRPSAPGSRRWSSSTTCRRSRCRTASSPRWSASRRSSKASRTSRSIRNCPSWPSSPPTRRGSPPASGYASTTCADPLPCAYEPDVVLIMNEKYDVVARHHLVYDIGNAERFHNWAVISIEKNRSGRDKIDIEFMKRFEHGRFDTDGRQVVEQLVDERVFVE